MIFNIRVHNRDDHVKNVVFSLKGKGEANAPVYDLIFCSRPRSVSIP